MKRYKWLSVMLSIALVFSLLPAAILQAEGESSTITSQYLTINDEATTWLVSGEQPEEFGDFENGDVTGLSYYDGGELNFSLETALDDVAPGTYNISMEVFSETAEIDEAAKFYAITDEEVSTRLVYTGSGWTAPKVLTLSNVVVHEDGQLTIGILVSATNHYGYVRNIQIVSATSEGGADDDGDGDDTDQQTPPGAEEAFTSAYLNVNEQATTWNVTGTKPETFRDFADSSNENAYGLEYWDGTAVKLELQTELEDLSAGTYSISLDVFTELADKGTMGLYASSSKDEGSVELTSTYGQWADPKSIVIPMVEVDTDGKLTISIRVDAQSHYGYVRNIELTKIETVSSEHLTINGEATTWVFDGVKPETFRDFADTSNSNAYGLEYWDGEEVNFLLQKELVNIEPGLYTATIEVHANPQDDSYEDAVSLLATTATAEYGVSGTGSIGSWGSPEVLTLADIEVGADGKLTLGVQLDAVKHYGYARNIKLIQGKPVSKLEVKPNSAILRPEHTYQLTVNEADVVFTSSDEDVAIVSETGLVTATGNGEAVITAQVIENGEAIAKGVSQVFVSDSLQTNYAPIVVEPVAELQGDKRSDFIMGADISMLYELAQIDRKYYTADGVEQGIIEQLKDNGVNWIRLRSWVDPNDEHGNPYGGGNINTEVLVDMAKQVKQADLKLLVDLHYSDFWTDPARQSIPKSWASLTEEELEQKVYDYTTDVLEQLYAEDVYPDMIQIGNETNTGLLWPLGGTAQKAKKFIAKGIEAVRDFEQAKNGEHIDIVIHRANPGDGVNTLVGFYGIYNDLDYDVMGLSYYPFWHGTLDNLQQVMNTLEETYERKVAIVETSYAYTLEDTILNGNTGHIFSVAQQDASNYKATVQGQANAIRDVIEAVAKVPNNNGIGIFYWEPGWLMGTDTGWGTKAAASYQNEEINEDGGSGWANQALFNYFGEALPSIRVFKDVRGSGEDYVQPTIVEANDITLVTSEEVFVELPTTAQALFTDDTYRNVPIINWSPETYDYKKSGTYELTGTIEGGATITATVTVRPKNYVVNPGIENSSIEPWVLDGMTKDTEKYAGSYAIHFWGKDNAISAKQVITDLPSGKYQLSVQSRLGIDKDPKTFEGALYAITDGNEYEAQLSITGWDKWKLVQIDELEVTNGTLEIGVKYHGKHDDYGDFDEFELILIERYEEEPQPSPKPTPRPTSSPSTDDPAPTSAPVVTPVVVDGVTTLQATLKESDQSITISADMLSANKDADLVVKWAEQQITITSDQLQQFSGKDVVITLKTSKLSPSANSQVRELAPPITLQAEAAASNDTQAIDLFVNWHVDTKEVSPSVALYIVNADGTLQYVQPANVDGIYELESGVTYVLASVTRAFTDVTAQGDAVRKLAAMGILEGNQLGELNLQSPATRAEVSKLVAKVSDLLFGADFADDDTNIKQFTDVPDQHWAKSYIDKLSARQWLLGVAEQSFAPQATMSYEQFYILLARMLTLSEVEASDEVIALGGSSWSAGYLQALVDQQIVTVEDLEGEYLTTELTREALFELMYVMVTLFEQ